MIEVWYHGVPGIAPLDDPEKVGEVESVDQLPALVEGCGREGAFRTVGLAQEWESIYFKDRADRPKSWNALRDLLAVLQSNRRFNPDPKGCLAQAIAASHKALAEEGDGAA